MGIIFFNGLDFPAKGRNGMRIVLLLFKVLLKLEKYMYELQIVGTEKSGNPKSGGSRSENLPFLIECMHV